MYLTVDGSLGNNFSFLQSVRMSVWRDLKLSMLLGRHLRLLQKYRFKKVRAVKQLIDKGGTFLIAIQLKLSFDRLFIIPVNFGNELIFEQNVSLSSVRDCITVDMQGRSVRDLQPSKNKYSNLLSCPIDGWISTKLQHHERFSSSSIGTPEKSGVLIRFSEWLRSMNFNSAESCYQKKSFH